MTAIVTVAWDAGQGLAGLHAANVPVSATDVSDTLTVPSGAKRMYLELDLGADIAVDTGGAGYSPGHVEVFWVPVIGGHAGPRFARPLATFPAPNEAMLRCGRSDWLLVPPGLFGLVVANNLGNSLPVGATLKAVFD